MKTEERLSIGDLAVFSMNYKRRGIVTANGDNHITIKMSNGKTFTDKTVYFFKGTKVDFTKIELEKLKQSEQ